MPIDPMIPLMAKPLNVMSPYQVQEGAQQIQGMQQKNALMGMQIQEEQRALQERNALLGTMRQPGMTDPETGKITGKGFNALSTISPKLSLELQQKQSLAEQEHNMAIYNKVRAKLGEMKIDDAEAAKISDVKTGMARAYEAALPSMGKDGAKAYVEQKIAPDLISTLKSSGHLRPSAADKLNPVFNPDTYKIELEALKTHAEDVKQKESALKEADKQSVTLVGPQGQQLKLDKSSGKAKMFDLETQKFVDWNGNLQGFTPINQPTVEMAAAKAGAVAKAKEDVSAASGYGATYENMSQPEQETVDWYATMQLGGDTTWRTGLARNKGGSQLIKAVDERVPQRAAELNLTPADVGTNKAIRTASQAALTQNTKDLAMLKPYVSMLDQNTDILKGLAKKAILTDAALANRPLNWLRVNASDNPNVAEYLAQIEIVKNEATRVISNPRLVGQMTDTARQEIESIINGNMPLNATERVLNRIQNDGQRRITTMETQQQELQSKIKKMFPTGDSGSTPKGGESTPAPTSAPDYSHLWK
jgi:hypothetical protein